MAQSWHFARRSQWWFSQEFQICIYAYVSVACHYVQFAEAVCTHTCMPIYLYVYLDTFLFSSMRITGAECDRCHRRWICQPAFLPLAGWLACGQCGLTMHETYATTIWLQIMIISRMSGHLAAHCCLLVICIS